MTFAIAMGGIGVISIFISYNVVMYYRERRRNDLFSCLVTGLDRDDTLGFLAIPIDIFSIDSHDSHSLNVELVSLIYKVVVGIMVFISLIVLPCSYFYVHGFETIDRIYFDDVAEIQGMFNRMCHDIVHDWIPLDGGVTYVYRNVDPDRYDAILLQEVPRNGSRNC